MSEALNQLEPLRHVRTGSLEVAYFEAGPPEGDVELLLHGYPYDVHSYVDVILLLADAGLRVIAPYLRGHGPTRFLDPSTPRSGQQAALGRDVVELMDALGIPGAVLGGYDWGARPACVVVGSVAGSLHQARLGERLPDPGHRRCGRADPARARGRVLVLLLLR